jgi:site-specific DNA-methyltransferase (adenine-specific)
MTASFSLHHGDARNILPTIDSGSVHLILVDPPYGVTSLKWDSVLPLDWMWAEIERILTPTGTVCVFGKNPFGANVISHKMSWFRYEYVWVKEQASNFCNVKFMPGAQTESIYVFSPVSPKRMVYNAQMITRTEPQKITSTPNTSLVDTSAVQWSSRRGAFRRVSTETYPTNVLRFNRVRGGRDVAAHPTQKPVPLLAHLVRTHSSVGDVVLDFTMGSGSTGVAAMQERRSFVGVEIDDIYFKTAQRRVTTAANTPV